MQGNILVLSCLFPNAVQPNYGMFVLNRVKAVSRHCTMRVIAPVPVYPMFNRALRGLRGAARIPRIERIEALEVHHPRFLVIPRFLKWLDALTYSFAVEQVVRRIDRDGASHFDLIDVHWTYPDIVAGYWLARRKRKKLLVTIRGREALYPGEVTLRRWMLVRCLRRADAVITLSDELKDLVIAMGVSAKCVNTILNGVDRTRFYARPPAECRRRLGIPANKRVLVSVGSLTRRKRHDELIRTMPTLSKRHDVELYIIGGPGPEGDMSAALSAMISNLRLSNVHLVDKVDNATLGEWYGAADLFCLASKGEGCPNVVLEALACGTPVVCTDVGAIRELLTDGINGFVVDAGSIDDLEPAIEKALEWTWDRQRIADGMDRWGWAHCADEVVRIYRSVLEEASGVGSFGSGSSNEYRQ